MNPEERQDPVLIHRTTTIICPHCNRDSGQIVDHLRGATNAKVGPWFCDACDCSFHVQAIEGEFSTIKAADKRMPVLVLLKHCSAPTYLVVEHDIYAEDVRDESIRELAARLAYFFNEHTCPTNFIRGRKGACGIAMSHAGEMDPHGVFEFVDAVPAHVVGDDPSSEDIDWLKVFPEMSENES